MTSQEKILYTAAFLLIAISVYVQCAVGDAGDKVWLLLVSRMWLEGKKLYVDLFEVNMPLITWIDAAPVYLSAHLSFLKDYQWLGLLGTLIIVCSVYVCIRLVRYHSEFAHNKNKQIQFALLLFYVFIFLTNPAYFFDREQIFLVLAFPYMMRWMPALASAALPLSLRIIIGLMAGVGFCMKPHTLIIWAGIQLIYILRERRLRILWCLENILIYTLGLLYLLAVWWLTPEYFATVLPMALLTYSATSRRQGGLLFSSVALVTFGVTFIDFQLRQTSPYRKDIYYFCALLIPLFAYAFINNGWGYTYNLPISVILILTGWALWEYRHLRKRHISQGHEKEAKKSLFGERACTINLVVNGLLVVALWGTLLTAKCEDYLECRISEKFSTLMKEGHIHSFGTLSISFLQWTELVNESGAAWDTRFSQLWMLPKFFASDDAFARQHHWVLDYIADAYAQDLNRRKPEVIFVDDADIFYSVHKHVDLLAYFSAFPNFTKAWQHYHYERTLDLCHEEKRTSSDRVGVGCRYFMYRRLEIPASTASKSL